MAVMMTESDLQHGKARRPRDRHRPRVIKAGALMLRSDVLVVGSGATGMYAAIAAARAGSHVLLVDRSLIGRGGATVMAQMTVAVAVGEEEPTTGPTTSPIRRAVPRALRCGPVTAPRGGRPGVHPKMDEWGVG